MSFMSNCCTAPFTDAEVEAIRQYQDGPEPLLCPNGNSHADPASAPVLGVDKDGLICPDINCANVVTSVRDHVVNGRFNF